jgi:hypothetical protein
MKETINEYRLEKLSKALGIDIKIEEGSIDIYR